MGQGNVAAAFLNAGMAFPTMMPVPSAPDWDDPILPSVTLDTFLTVSVHNGLKTGGGRPAGAAFQGSHFEGFIEALRRIPGVRDPVKSVSLEGKNHLDLLVVDGARMSKNRMENEWTYSGMTLEDFEDHPEVLVSAGLYRRPLLYASFCELSPEILFLGMIETNPDFHGKGIGSLFYEELTRIARRSGYRFVGHYHNEAEVAGFFLRRGCYFLDEIGSEFQDRVEPIRKEEANAPVFHTVYFTDPSDAGRFVRPEALHRSVDDRLDMQEKSMNNLTLENIHPDRSLIAAPPATTFPKNRR